MIKLVAIDLDGTLLNGKKEITPRNKAALIAAKAKGVESGYLYGTAVTCHPSIFTRIEFRRGGRL